MVLDKVILVPPFSMLNALLNQIICESSEIFFVFKILATIYLFWIFPSVSLVILKMVFLKSLAKLSSKWIILGSTTEHVLLIEPMLFVPIQRNIFRDL